MTGGTYQETDSELRTRWKTTAFRSNAGTESMYLGLALNDPYVTAALVLGASKRRREQVQIIGGAATSTAVDCVYAFPTGVYLGPNIDGGALLIRDVDYTWNTTFNPPRVVIAARLTTYDTGTVDSLGVELLLSPVDRRSKCRRPLHVRGSMPRRALRAGQLVRVSLIPPLRNPSRVS